MGLLKALRLALTGAFVLVLAASSAEASSARLKMRGAAAGVPADLTVTMRQTEDRFVDMKAWLDTIPAENYISTTVTGDVKLKVVPLNDPAWTQASGTRSYSKRRLYPVYSETPSVAASTSGAGASSGIGSWTFTALTGADGTGAISTFRVSFNGTSAPDLNFKIGQNTLAGFSGFDLNKLPGSTSDKVVLGTQSHAGLYAIFTDAPSGSARVAFAGTYGSTTRTYGTPPLGASWVDVQDNSVGNAWSGQIWRINFTVVANRWSVAARTGTDAVNSNQLSTTLGQPLCFGSEVALEPGNYAGTWSTFIATAAPLSCASTPGVGAPTAPFADGTFSAIDPLTFPATPNAGIKTLAPGYIKVFCTAPISAATPCTVPSGGQGLRTNRTGRNYYLAIGNIRGAPSIDTITGVGAYWLAYYNSEPVIPGVQAQFSWNLYRDNNANFLFWRNYINGGGVNNVGTVAINCRDCLVSQNTWDNVMGDRLLHFMWNSTSADRTFVELNLWKNQPTACQAHIDNLQMSMVETGTIYRGLAANTRVNFADYLFNWMTRGNGDYQTASPPVGAQNGKICNGSTEQVYIGNHGPVYTRSDIFHEMKFVGNFSNDTGQWGFDLPRLSNDSLLANNQVNWAYEVTSDFLSGSGPNAAGWDPAYSGGPPGRQPIDLASEASIKIYRNVTPNSAFADVWFQGDPGAGAWSDAPTNTIPNPLYCGGYAACRLTTPVLVDNWTPGYAHNTSGGLASMQATYVNPTVGGAAQTFQDLMAAWMPKPGSAPDSFTKPAGPFFRPGRLLADPERGVVSPEIYTP